MGNGVEREVPVLVTSLSGVMALCSAKTVVPVCSATVGRRDIPSRAIVAPVILPVLFATISGLNYLLVSHRALSALSGLWVCTDSPAERRPFLKLCIADWRFAPPLDWNTFRLSLLGAGVSENARRRRQPAPTASEQEPQIGLMFAVRPSR